MEQHLTERAGQNVIVRIMEAAFRENPDLNPFVELQRKWQGIRDAQAADKAHHWFHCQIGLGPSDLSNQKIIFSMEQVRDITNQKWLLQGVYCFEYSSEDGTHGHPHVHLACQTKYSLKNLRKCLKEQFRAKLGLAPNFVAVEPMLTKTHVRNTLAYCSKSRPQDCVMRLALGLRPLYYAGSMTPEQYSDHQDKPPTDD